MGNEFPVIVLDGKEKFREGLFLFLNSVHGFFILMVENYGVELVVKVIGEIFGELIIEPD